MAEAEGKMVGNHAIPQMNGHSRDLLQIYIPGKTNFSRKFDDIAPVGDAEEDDEIELSLGLSLNGRFGVDPKRAKTLIRSSSVSEFVFRNSNNINDVGAARVERPAEAYAPLSRTCSLPTETEEEWRKRKEIQSLRRMAAKRKRLEKMKNAARTNGEENVQMNGSRSSQGSDCRCSSQAAGGGGRREGLPPIPSPQGSAGSSGNTESDGPPTQGTNRSIEARSPGGIRTPPKQKEQKRLVSLNSVTEKAFELVGAPAADHPSSNVTVSSNGNKEISRDEVASLPCVSTRGIGPNGKDIEGFLYGYRKGEEVKIVCVCHGLFHSPAEFVKHAGGGDVENPLKHIVVSASSLL